MIIKKIINHKNLTWGLFLSFFIKKKICITNQITVFAFGLTTIIVEKYFLNFYNLDSHAWSNIDD